MILRAATDADHGAIWDMLRPVFRAGQTYAIDPDISQEAALRYWLGGHSYLAQDPNPVGTYYIQPNRPGGGAHYCNCGFITDPRAQGRGVARAMIEHALPEAKRLGYAGMVFNFVVANNARAVTTWDLYGFEEVGRVPGGFRPKGGAPVDTLVMFKPL